jgi:hypothetical protein
MTFNETITVSLITSVFTALIVGTSGAYFSTWLALRRYRLEKWWDKKALNYEVLFESIYDIHHYYEVELEKLVGREYNEEYVTGLHAASEKGYDNIHRQARIGSFILSSEAESIVLTLENSLERASSFHNWEEVASECERATREAFSELRFAAQDDLGSNVNLPGVKSLERLRTRLANRPGQEDLGGRQ